MVWMKLCGEVKYINWIFGDLTFWCEFYSFLSWSLFLLLFLAFSFDILLDFTSFSKLRILCWVVPYLMMSYFPLITYLFMIMFDWFSLWNFVSLTWLIFSFEESWSWFVYTAFSLHSLLSFQFSFFFSSLDFFSFVIV